MNRSDNADAVPIDAPRGTRAAPADEEIYRSIYTAIVERHVLPGTKLPENVLAQALGVSRTRIRTALQRLAHENLLTLRPNRGASVAQPTVKQAREVFLARQILESGAIAHIVRLATDDQLRALGRVVARERAARRQNDRGAAIKLSGQFHLELVRLLDNATLSDVLRALVFRTSLILSQYEKPGRSGCLHEDHARLIKLIAGRDAKSAAACMITHLTAIEASLDFRQAEPRAARLRDVFARLRLESR